MTISTKQLTRTKDGFCAELSDFGPRFNWTQVYPDACDAGIILESHKTGTQIRFYLDETNTTGHTGDNEISHYTLKPVPEDLRKLPLGWRNMKVTLFND